jgi:Major Facilitator Superfamily
VPFGWRAVFVAVGIAALTALSLVAFLLPEPRPAHQRISGSVRSVFGSFGELLQNRHFLGLTFIGGLDISSFFAFLSTSSFVYIGHYGFRRNTAEHSRSMPSASLELRNLRASSVAVSVWAGWYWQRFRPMRCSRCCYWG